LAHRKGNTADCVSVSSRGHLSTHSADLAKCSSPVRRVPASLKNTQSSYLSAGSSALGSEYSGKKRRREFLDLASNSQSELVRFVLDTQGKLDKEGRG